MKVGELSKIRATEIQEQLETIPFAKLLGIELDEIDSGIVTLGLEIRDDLKRNNGIVHGGAIVSLIDTACAFATISLLEATQRATTIDLTVNFLRPLSSGRATATAKVIRTGRRIVVVTGEAFDKAGTLVATALSTLIRD